MDPMDNIYSPENIARSRGRAAAIRAKVADGTLTAEWLETAAEMEAYADEREQDWRAQVQRNRQAAGL